MKKIALSAILILILSATVASAQVPMTLNHQGFLTAAGGSGTVPNGQYDLTFRLYDVASGPDPALWTEIHQDIEVDDGLYSVILGSVVPLTLPFDRTYYLSVQVETDDPLEPRVELTSTPYSIRAKYCETAVGGIGGGGTIGHLAKFTAPDMIGDSIVQEAGGKIGVNDAPADATFYALNSEYEAAIKGVSVNKEGIMGISTAENPWLGAVTGLNEGNGWGVLGGSLVLDGVLGKTESPTPTHAGVSGINYGAGVGVNGLSHGDEGVGVKGTGQLLGGDFHAEGTQATTYGIRSQASTSTGNLDHENYGAYLVADGEVGVNVGVYARAENSSDDRAGWFVGNLRVDGQIHGGGNAYFVGWRGYFDSIRISSYDQPSPELGTLWYDASSHQLKIYTNVGWKVVVLQ